MHISTLVLTVIPLLPTFTAADAISDFNTLQSTIASTSAQMLSTIFVSNATTSVSGAYGTWNQTYEITQAKIYPTTSTLQNISAIIEASRTGVGVNQKNFVNGRSDRDLNSAYLDYANEVLGLSNALVSRGRAWHGEPNQPVSSAIRTLSSNVNLYGFGLTRRGIITETSSVRTFTAANSLIDAEDAWRRAGNLPGPGGAITRRTS